MGYRWTCKADGECCRVAGPVVMTIAESAVLRTVTTRAMVFHGEHGSPLVTLQPLPGTTQCPLLGDDGKCTVYASRPYNCRRFACLRQNNAEEPLVVGGPLGCINAECAVKTHPDALDFYTKYQRKAQPWARAHGWTEAMA